MTACEQRKAPRTPTRQPRVKLSGVISMKGCLKRLARAGIIDQKIDGAELLADALESCRYLVGLTRWSAFRENRMTWLEDRVGILLSRISVLRKLPVPDRHSHNRHTGVKSIHTLQFWRALVSC